MHKARQPQRNRLGQGFCIEYVLREVLRSDLWAPWLLNYEKAPALQGFRARMTVKLQVACQVIVFELL